MAGAKRGQADHRIWPRLPGFWAVCGPKSWTPNSRTMPLFPLTY